MKCCRRYVSQTFAINTFRFAIFSSKKPFPTRVFSIESFLTTLWTFLSKKLLIFLIFQNKNTKMLTNFITKTFYYMTYSSFPCRLIGTLCQSESSKLKKIILTYLIIWLVFLSSPCAKIVNFHWFLSARSEANSMDRSSLARKFEFKFF